MDVAGRVALVTGASSGIGRATAIALAAAGARVLLTGRDERALAEASRLAGGEARAADLADPEAVAALAAWAGEVDVLVNNAGFGLAGPFASLAGEEIERLLRVNLAAPIQLTRALLPGMRERDRGHVANVASIAGHVGVQGEVVYSATKGGLITFTEALRYELRGSGVGVSLVTPGVVDTRFFDRGGLSYTRRFPRPIRAERVAAAVLRAIRGDLAEVFAPRWMAVPAWLRGAAPGLYRSGASRWG